MKTCFKQLINVSLILAGFLAAIFSCTFEDDKEDPVGPTILIEKEVSFSIKLPNNSTRSLTLADENELKDVKVFVFNQSGVLHYYTDAFLASPTSSDITVKKYNAKLPATPNGEKIDLMVISNAGSILVAKYPNGLPLNQDMTKDDLAQALTLEKASGWVSQKNAEGYLPIPMWGWVSGVFIHPETGLDANHSIIALTRMLAKVNVGIIGDAQAVFKLSGVYLMNRNTVGRVIPDITGEDPWTGTAPKATAPSLPADPKPKKGAANYLLYGESYLTDASAPFEMKGVVYSFEAQKGVPYAATKEYEESPCLIIGGKYADSQTVTYYRVDFVKSGSDGVPVYLHLLRNYLYDVSISQVTGPGYPTVEDALKSRPVNLIGEVVPWIDSDMPIQVSDGIHVLSVDKDLLQFYATGESQIIRVYTDVDNGWRINTANLPAWLHFISPSPDTASMVRGEPLKYIELTLKTDELASTAAPRETLFTVEAGVLKKSITIKQSNESKLSVQAVPNALIFPLSAPESKTIKVTTIPANATRIVNFVRTGNIAFLPGKGPADYNGTTATEFVIQPTPGTSGSVFMTIRINSASGASDTEVVQIVQLNTDSNFGIIGVPDLGYEAADMGIKSFNVVSDVPWKFMMHDNPSNLPNEGKMITITDETEHPPSPGILMSYSFILGQNPGYAERIAQMGVLSSAPGWQYFTFPIRQKGTPPNLLITYPDPKKRDFSVLDSAFTVIFNTNAGWKFYGDENYGKVIAATDSLHNHVYTGSNNGLNSVQRTVTFTPVQTTNDTLVAGNTVSTVVKFETANHPADVPPSVQELVLYHSIKERWGGVFYSFDPVSDTLTITAYTNGEWNVKNTEGLGNKVVAAANYGPQTVHYLLPGFDEFAEATFNFSAWPTSNPSAHKDTAVYRPPSTLFFTGQEGFPTSGKIPAKGMALDNSPYYLNFGGTYTGPFNIRVITNDQERGTVVEGRDKHRRINIQSTSQWEDRKLTFEYQNGVDMQYMPIEYLSFIQEGYSIRGNTVRDRIPASGGSVTEYIGGWFPAMRVYANISGGSIVSTTIAAGDTVRPNIQVPASVAWDLSRVIRFVAEDITDPTKKFELSTVNQDGFNIMPREHTYPGVLRKEGSSEVEATFTGDFPPMIVETNNPDMVQFTYPEIPAGKSLNLSSTRINILENTGPVRSATIYLKDKATETVRATMYLTQEGEHSDYIVIGPFSNCVAWISSDMEAEYEIVDPSAISGMTGEKLRQICIANSHPTASIFASTKPNNPPGVGGAYNGSDLLSDGSIRPFTGRVCQVNIEAYALLRKK
jgi:hypothetical protein